MTSSAANNNYPVAEEVVTGEYINVMTVDDRTFQVETNPAQTLEEFRMAITQVTGIAPGCQRLICNGRLLFGETQPLGLPHNSYVHLAPISLEQQQYRQQQQQQGGNEDDNDSDFNAHMRLTAHMSQLNAAAWLIVVYYSLVSWRLMMVIAFEQDEIQRQVSEQTKQDYFEKVLLPSFLTSLFGVFVGLFGLWTASYRDLPNAHGKLRWYALLITILALFSFLSSLEYMDSNSIMAVFIVQMMFWYCILQVRITEHAYVQVHGVRVQQQQARIEEITTTQSPVIVVAQAQPVSAAEANNNAGGRRDVAVMV